MNIFEDLNRFLETKLEEFLKNNPDLQIQILLEQLEKEEKDTLKLIKQLENEKKSLEKEILTLGEDIKLWHGRIEQATKAKRDDLSSAAQERKATLLRQGNQVWARMSGVKEKTVKSQELLAQIQERKKEVQEKYQREKINTKQTKSSDFETNTWQNSSKYTSVDDLEAEFHRLEIDEELERLKGKCK
jgi:uncharacterized protein (TIGR04376 family)